MNIPFIYTLLKTAKITAILSFLGGTFLLITYLYNTGSPIILNLGIYYALFALLINSILFFTLFVALIHSETKHKSIVKSLFFMILNVPICSCYVWLIIHY